VPFSGDDALVPALGHCSMLKPDISKLKLDINILLLLYVAILIALARYG
jgi:hypothetical protein